MALSKGQKRGAGIFLIAVLAWQFWTDPLGLAQTFNAAGGVLAKGWENFTIFMSALGTQ
jgi:hypothetical protein